MQCDALDLAALAGRVATLNPAACRVVTGFDAFVDEMITLVGERRSSDDFTAVPDISTFGGLITAAAGKSSLREIVVTDVHPGGCAVNLADGLASMGVVVDCFATLGDPVHPAFTEIADKCHGFHSWGCEPGRTLAFEFDDGKLMFSSVKPLGEFTPATVRSHLADGIFGAACATAQVIALTDWSLYPHMTEVWRMLQQEVFSGLKQRPQIFIDLVDPSSRSEDDIRGMAATLRGFESAGPVTLGLNGNEANILCRVHGLPVTAADAASDEVVRQAFSLRDLLGVEQVVVHQIPFAVSASSSGGFAQPSWVCAKPRKSTGAGDRFNAGLCLGLAEGLGAAESLALGCAVSGFFVRQARSPQLHEVSEFLRQWVGNIGEGPHLREASEHP